jgi:hypothetical protein
MQRRTARIRQDPEPPHKLESGKTQNHHTTLVDLNIDDKPIDDDERLGKRVEAWT